jgi:hypothetical protein
MPESCEVAPPMEDLVQQCFSSYCDTEPPEGGTTWMSRQIVDFGLVWRVNCHGSSDKSTFGPPATFNEWTPDAHTRPINGHFGQYGPGAFVEELAVNDANEAQQALASLRNASWIDGATRAVMAELSVYTATSNKLVYAQFFVEFPAESTLAVTTSNIMPFNGFPVLYRVLGDRNSSLTPMPDAVEWPAFIGAWHDSNDMIELWALALLLLLVVYNCIYVEILELRKKDVLHYILSFFNLMDMALVVFHMRVFQLEVRLVLGEHSYADIDWSTTDGFVNLRPLAYWQEQRQILLSFTLILAWIKLLEPLSAVFKSIFVLVDMMYQMSKKLVYGMFPILAIVYFAWSLARYTLLSDTDWNHRTLVSSFVTLYPDVLGEFQWRDEYDPNDHLAKSLFVVFVLRIVFSVAVVLIMLNLLISILNDEYEEVKKEADKNWCRFQATALFLDKHGENIGVSSSGSLSPAASSERKAKRFMCFSSATSKSASMLNSRTELKRRLESKLLNLQDQTFGSGSTQRLIRQFRNETGLTGYLQSLQNWSDEWEEATLKSARGTEFDLNDHQPDYQVLERLHHEVCVCSEYQLKS